MASCRFDYERRRRALETALEKLEMEGNMPTLAVSAARIQGLLVELDKNGQPLLPAPWIKWASSKAEDIPEYNDTRFTLTGDQLLKPEDFGVLLNRLHPAYIAVVNDYARRGLRLNKSVRIYARSATLKQAMPDTDTCRWSDLVEHLVGTINALPAAQRAVITQRLHMG